MCPLILQNSQSPCFHTQAKSLQNSKTLKQENHLNILNSVFGRFLPPKKNLRAPNCAPLAAIAVFVPSHVRPGRRPSPVAPRVPGRSAGPATVVFAETGPRTPRYFHATPVRRVLKEAEWTVVSHGSSSVVKDYEGL